MTGLAGRLQTGANHLMSLPEGVGEAGAQQTIRELRAALSRSREETVAARRMACRARETSEAFELLVREVDHRAKNSLQLAAAMLLMQAQASEDGRVQHQLRAAVARLSTLAEIHAALYRVQDHKSLAMQPWLERVCDGFQWNPRVALEISAPADPWPVELTTPVGLFVGEAVANAVKHAFRDGEGRIRVCLQPAGSGCWLLEVSDDGAGIPTERTGAGDGLGMKLLGVFARQLRGKVAIGPGLEGRGTGVSVVFSGPVEPEENLL